MTWDMILYFQCEMKGVQHLFKKQQEGNPPSCWEGCEFCFLNLHHKENKRWQAGTRNTEKGTPPSSNFNVIMPRTVSTLSGNINVLCLIEFRIPSFLHGWRLRKATGSKNSNTLGETGATLISMKPHLKNKKIKQFMKLQSYEGDYTDPWTITISNTK